MFNPHNNHTSDGVLIVEGMAVTDYNRDRTTVVKDLDAEKEWKCCGLVHHTRRNDLSPDTTGHEPACSHDHWFQTANGGMFNGSRLESR